MLIIRADDSKGYIRHFLLLSPHLSALQLEFGPVLTRRFVSPALKHAVYISFSEICVVYFIVQGEEDLSAETDFSKGRPCCKPPQAFVR